MKPTLNFRARLLGLALALGCAAAMPARAEIETFSIDNTHSFANWELRHVVARTSGTFWDIKGKVLLDTGNLAKSSVDATISIYSLNSSHLRRDVHVLTDEFLDARNYPEAIRFFERYTSDYRDDKLLYAAAFAGLGACAENQGQFADAAAIAGAQAAAQTIEGLNIVNYQWNCGVVNANTGAGYTAAINRAAVNDFTITSDASLGTAGHDHGGVGT